MIVLTLSLRSIIEDDGKQKLEYTHLEQMLYRYLKRILSVLEEYMLKVQQFHLPKSAQRS